MAEITLEFLGRKLQQLLDHNETLTADGRRLSRSLDNFRNEVSAFRSETMHRFDELDEKLSAHRDRIDRQDQRITNLEDR